MKCPCARCSSNRFTSVERSPIDAKRIVRNVSASAAGAQGISTHLQLLIAGKLRQQVLAKAFKGFLLKRFGRCRPGPLRHVSARRSLRARTRHTAGRSPWTSSLVGQDMKLCRAAQRSRRPEGRHLTRSKQRHCSPRRPRAGSPTAFGRYAGRSRTRPRKRRNVQHCTVACTPESAPTSNGRLQRSSTAFLAHLATIWARLGICALPSKDLPALPMLQRRRFRQPLAANAGSSIPSGGGTGFSQAS